MQSTQNFGLECFHFKELLLISYPCRFLVLQMYKGHEELGCF